MSLTWVGHQEVARREIKGEWLRFKYYINDNLMYVYCRTQITFLKLFASWCSYGGREYRYRAESTVGEYIPLDKIIMDHPEGQKFHCKILINSQAGEYIQ